MKRAGFSLIELLVASALSAVLMAGVLAVMTGVARDRRRLNLVESQPNPEPMIDRFQWDLTNARTFNQSPDAQSLVLVGHGGIDNLTLAPSGRLTRVIYRIYRDGKTTCLVREQQYLDDPVSFKPWRELVAVGTTAFRVLARSTDLMLPEADPRPSSGRLAPLTGPGGVNLRVPDRVLLQIDLASGRIERELWVR